MLQRNCCANEYDPGLWSLKLYCNAEIEQSDLCYENTFGIVCPAGSICDASSLNSNDNTTCFENGLNVLEDGRNNLRTS